MNKNRYLICLLVSGILLYYAVPRLTINSPGLEGYFTISWLLFALMVIAGNLTALLYTPSKKKKQQPLGHRGRKQVKARNYN
ncbi:hypothetical protein R4Z10_17070 [Niallia sp. XMNu-256]|uniref:hypothetical protein n=1 Tax=Niallia sp. XMNu-256 TaxID=3082444 RepID=UPI0030D24B4A